MGWESNAIKFPKSYSRSSVLFGSSGRAGRNFVYEDEAVNSSAVMGMVGACGEREKERNGQETSHGKEQQLWWLNSVVVLEPVGPFPDTFLFPSFFIVSDAKVVCTNSFLLEEICEI